MTDDKADIIAGLKRVDGEFAERALALLRQYHAASLLDVPRTERADLMKWRTEEYRKVYGLEPVWGDPTPESKREKRRGRRQDNGEPREKLTTEERREKRRARRRELREVRRALKDGS